MEFDNGDYEILSKEEWCERIYGSGFEAPLARTAMQLPDFKFGIMTTSWNVSS